MINLGFWPGGDRDGNPFVTTDITLKTAQGLRCVIRTIIVIFVNYEEDSPLKE